MKRSFLSLAVLAAGIASPGAQALESYSNYDRFTAAPIDASRWTTFERTRQIKGQALNHVHRESGQPGSDTGGTSVNFSTNLANPSLITQLKGTIRVNAVEVTNCATNAGFNGSINARMIGSFFNTGTPVNGSQVGDMLAQVNLARAANSTDAPGVLQVQGSVLVCQNSDCSQVSIVGTFAGLGTATVGQDVALKLEWDKATKTFTAVRDGSITSVVTYTQSDRAGPGNPFKNLSTRSSLANCTGTRPVGNIDASFDSIAVNRSAAP